MACMRVRTPVSLIGFVQSLGAAYTRVIYARIYINHFICISSKHFTPLSPPLTLHYVRIGTSSPHPSILHTQVHWVMADLKGLSQNSNLLHYAISPPPSQPLTILQWIDNPWKSRTFENFTYGHRPQPQYNASVCIWLLRSKVAEILQICFSLCTHLFTHFKQRHLKLIFIRRGPKAALSRGRCHPSDPLFQCHGLGNIDTSSRFCVNSLGALILYNLKQALHSGTPPTVVLVFHTLLASALCCRQPGMLYNETPFPHNNIPSRVW